MDNRLFSGDGLRDIGRSIVDLPRNLGTMTRNVVSNPLTNEITSYINSPRNEELIILQSDMLLASNTNMPLPRVTDIETINQVRQLFEAAGIALLAGDTILVPAIAAVGGTYMLYRGGRLVANVVRKRKE